MKVNILGVKIDSLIKEKVLKKINQFLSDIKQHYIATPNPEMVVAAQKDNEFLEILNKAELAVPDGFGLLLASRYLRRPIPERIPGVDLMLDICRIAEQKKYSVFLVAEKNGLAKPKETAEALIKKFSQLKIDGGVLGREESENELIEKINIAKPEILFVALGARLQEKFITENLSKVPSVKIAMGVGGALDFIAGKIKRAPQWIQKIGLEWLWRLFMQPWRWKRILTATIKFSWLIITKGKKYA